MFHRAIERIYTEYCEKNSKESPEYLDSSLSDDLMLTDSAVWAKVHILIKCYYETRYSWMTIPGANPLNCAPSTVKVYGYMGGKILRN